MALKHRYDNLGEMVGDYKALLRGMDDHTPRDPAFRPSEPKPKVQPLQEARADKPAKPKVIAEAAFLSRYSNARGAIDSFRVLAGMEDREVMPWDPGSSTTAKSVLREEYGMDEEPVPGADPSPGIRMKPPKPGFSAKAAHKALDHSERTLSLLRHHNAMLPHHDAKTAASIKMDLAKHSTHAAEQLHAASEGAPDEVRHQLHAMAAHHEKHAHIYLGGGRPKMEDVEIAQAVLEDIQIN